MGKGAPLRWLENRILARHLRGRGIEIGALWRKFPVPRRVRVYYLDRLAGEELHQHYAELSQPVLHPDLVADAMQLPFSAGTLDFVLASHVLEHLPFPLAALRHWYEALRPGGVLLLKVPDKRYTFDRKRQRTSLQHLIAEDANAAAFDRQAHFEDWVENVVGRSRAAPDFDGEVARLLQCDYSIHYHAWIDQDLRQLLGYTGSTMGLRWRTVVFWNAHVYRKECIALLQRM
ncbi:MAG TPA: class I SAM-dependent methyltransferase [Candidatus Binatia bacterium]|nr:class I SAM-dependent methyltransferase [Candidatus Binatia bacterium]